MAGKRKKQRKTQNPSTERGLMLQLLPDGVVFSATELWENGWFEREKLEQMIALYEKYGNDTSAWKDPQWKALFRLLQSRLKEAIAAAGGFEKLGERVKARREGRAPLYPRGPYEPVQ